MNTEYLLDLIDMKESYFPIPYLPESYDGVGIHEAIYIGSLEMLYVLKKIENKDRLVNEIIETLDSLGGGINGGEARKLKVKLDVFLRYMTLYKFKEN